MKFFAVAAVFAATAVALPSANGGHKDPKQLSFKQAQNSCGKAQLSCCNKEIKSGDNTQKSSGILAGLLNNVIGGGGGQGIGLFDQCSDLSINAIIGLDDLLGKSTCNQNIACCDATNAEAEGGLVNVALPCVQLQDLI